MVDIPIIHIIKFMGIKQTSLGGAPKTRIPSTPYKSQNMLQPYEMTEKRVAYGIWIHVGHNICVASSEKPFRLGSTSK